METHEFTCQKPGAVSRTPALGGREQLIQDLLNQGCHETNGQITRTIASGDGLRIVQPLLRPRFRQGV